MGAVRGGFSGKAVRGRAAYGTAKIRIRFAYFFAR